MHMVAPLPGSTIGTQASVLKIMLDGGESAASFKSSIGIDVSLVTDRRSIHLDPVAGAARPEPPDMGEIDYSLPMLEAQTAYSVRADLTGWRHLAPECWKHWRIMLGIFSTEAYSTK